MRTGGSHYGDAMDAWIERAQAQPAEPDDDYGLVRRNFDYLHYALQTGLTDLDATDPVRAFLDTGADATADPSPHFSMSKYLARHPERADEPSPYVSWLREGRAAGEIADPAEGIDAFAPLLGMTPQQVTDELVALRSDTVRRLRTGTLGEMLRRAARQEPLIEDVWAATDSVFQTPFRGGGVAQAAAAIHAAHDQADLRTAQVVIVLGRARGPAARRMSKVATALSAQIDSDQIVLIYTDQAGTAWEGLHPPGVREVDFRRLLGGVGPRLREDALVALLRSMRADAIIGADSALFLDCLEPFGAPLAASERLFLSIGADDATAEGEAYGGALRWVYPAFEHLTGVLTSNRPIRRAIIEHFLVAPGDRGRIRNLARTSPEELTGWLLPGTVG